MHEHVSPLSNLILPLLEWFRDHHRILPWRSDPTPYHVWVSEIMLQQTRVAAVLGYYRRFMEALPTVSDLAQVDWADNVPVPMPTCSPWLGWGTTPPAPSPPSPSGCRNRRWMATSSGWSPASPATLRTSPRRPPKRPSVPLWQRSCPWTPLGISTRR